MKTNLMPNDEQLNAIKVYAAKHGTKWKRKLAAAWSRGTDTRELNGHLLRQVRNQLGPSWLNSFVAR